jgi:hypothetical protein
LSLGRFLRDAILDLSTVEPAFAAPIHPRGPWLFHALPLPFLDHLGIDKLTVKGFCIAGSFLESVAAVPDRRGRAVAAQWVAPKVRKAFYENNIKS